MLKAFTSDSPPREGGRLIPFILSACQRIRLAPLAPVQFPSPGGRAFRPISPAPAGNAFFAPPDDLSERPLPGLASGPAAHIDFTRLPAGAPHFLGHEAELAALDAAWAAAGQTTIVTLVAPAGTGKSTLLTHWLGRLETAGWGGARRVYGWRFCPPPDDGQQASDDAFLAAALAWFGAPSEAKASPWDKGTKLAEALRATRSLLLLDGVEALQYPAGPLAGRLRAPGLAALLHELARAGEPGLCVLTSRAPVVELAGFERPEAPRQGRVVRLELAGLSLPDGARLLHGLGVRRAGTAPLEATDAALQQASRDVHGHPLTLSLLGHYLVRVCAGALHSLPQGEVREAENAPDSALRRLLAAFESHFLRTGGSHAPELAALRLLGFFDRPASPAGLAALRAAPPIPGLTEALVSLDEPAWQDVLATLRASGLLQPAQPDGAVEAHPLVRDHFAERLRQHRPDAWQEGHRRLYVYFKESTPQRPNTLAGLERLYRAVDHGCRAGLHEAACYELYFDRILRGTGSQGFYSLRRFGAFGADLGALACFFVEPWRQVSPKLSGRAQAWLLHEAAERLCALGRLAEALAPLRALAELAVARQDGPDSAHRYGRLSELEQGLGHIPAACRDAETALAHAERSGDTYGRMALRVTLADALHQHGTLDAAHALFREAEALQAAREPDYPLLASGMGFGYAELLLGGAERAAWRQHLGLPGAEREAALQAAATVIRRGRQMLEWGQAGEALLEVAVDHLSLARAVLYAAQLKGEAPDPEHLEFAMLFLRAAGDEDYLLRGLLTSACFQHARGEPAAARAELAEAHRIATRSQRKRHLADLHLTQARLFRDPQELAAARALILEGEYFRRLPELEDAEAALGAAPC